MPSEKLWKFRVIVCWNEQNNRRHEHLKDIQDALAKLNGLWGINDLFSVDHQKKRKERILAAGDYYLTAVDVATGEEVVVMVIERKTCSDLFRSLRQDDTTFEGLSRMDAQMRQLNSCGRNVIKLLLIEGHEKKCRLQTFRERFHGYYTSIGCVQTESLSHTIDFICDQLEAIKRNFDKEQMAVIIQRSTHDLEGIKENVKDEMSRNRVFARYHSLVKNDVKPSIAMKKIRNENPNAGFICPTIYGDLDAVSLTATCKNCRECRNCEASYYNRQDCVSRFFDAVVRGVKNPLVEPVHHVDTNFYKGQRHYRGNQPMGHENWNADGIEEISECEYQAHCKEQRMEDLGSQRFDHFEHNDETFWGRAQGDSIIDAYAASLDQSMEELGSQRFHHGQYKGETFRQVVQSDPTYINRYMHANPSLARQRLGDAIMYFDWYKRTLSTARHQGNRRKEESKPPLKRRRRTAARSSSRASQHNDIIVLRSENMREVQPPAKRSRRTGARVSSQEIIEIIYL